MLGERLAADGEKPLSRPRVVWTARAFAHECFQDVVDEHAALGRIGEFSERLERPEPQDLSRVDRVGIADQRLDPRHRQPLRALLDRRRGSRALRLSAARGWSRLRASARISSPRASHLSGNLLAGIGGEPLQPARGDLRLAVLRGRRASARPPAGRAPARKSCAARPMRRSGGSSDSAVPHRAREQRIEPRLRRPGAFVQAAEHDHVDALQARLERAPDVDARIDPAAPPHHARSISAANRPG